MCVLTLWMSIVAQVSKYLLSLGCTRLLVPSSVYGCKTDQLVSSSVAAQLITRLLTRFLSIV